MELPRLYSNAEFWEKAIARILLLGFLLFSALKIERASMPFAGDSDSSGYLHNARLLLEGDLSGEVRPIGDLPLESIPRHCYQPLGFLVQPDLERQYPTYPFGLPLTIAFFDVFLGSEASVLVVIVLIAIATPLGVFLLGRELGLTEWWALVAAVGVGLGPVYVFMALKPLTDVMSACLAVYCLLLSLKAGRGLGYAILLGLVFSLLVITRLPNFLIALPVLATLLWKSTPINRYIFIALSGLPGAAFLFYVNTTLYGGPLETGYVGHWGLFKQEYFAGTMKHFGYWLGVNLTPLVVLAAVGSVFWIRKKAAMLTMLWLWMAPPVLFYAFYYHSGETWWSIRFIILVFPAVAITGYSVLQYLSENVANRFGRPWLGLVFAALVLVGVVKWEGDWNQRLVYLQHRNDDIYMKFRNWAEENAEREAIMVTMQLSGNVYYYLSNPLIRYDALTPDAWELVVREADRKGIPVYAPLFMFEWKEQKVLEKDVPGAWNLEQKFADCHLYRLDTATTLEILEGS